MSDTILIVDDEEHMRHLIRFYLQESGYEVVEAYDGHHALSVFNKSKVDLILLDIMMPHKDGWTLCKEIRRISRVPIIILTAKEETPDKVKGLKLGADDYLVKPFEETELLARMEVVFRRTNPDRQKEITYKNIKINKSLHQVLFNNKEINCTPKEFKLLDVLLSHPGKVLTREQLLDHVWGYESDRDTRTVDSHMKNLREKLRKHGINTDSLIYTVWGIGYRLGS